MASSYGTFNENGCLPGSHSESGSVSSEPAGQRTADISRVPCDTPQADVRSIPPCDSTQDPRDNEERDEVEIQSRREWMSQHKLQIVMNLLILVGTIAVTICVSVIGPSLLDLQLRLHTTIDHVTWLLSMKATGALVGVLTAGRTIDTRWRWLQLTSALAIVSGCCIGAPWPEKIYYSLPIFLLFGFTRAYFWCGSILTQFVLWEERKNSLSWLSGQQLCGSVGNMIGPLIVRPFLAEQNHSDTLTGYIGEYGYVAIDTEIFTFGPQPDIQEVVENVTNPAFGSFHNGTTEHTEVMYGYLIAGSIGLVASCVLLLGYFAMGGIHFESNATNRNNATANRVRRDCSHYLVMVILVLCNIVFGSITRNYVSFIVAYTVHHLHWTKSEGAYLASAMSVAGMIWKFVCIYLVRIVKLELQLFAGVFMCLGASLLLLFLADKYYIIPWLATVLYMVGLTNVNSTVFGWVDKVLVMRGVVGVLWNVGGCIGEIIAPFILGYLFRHVSYEAFTYYFVSCTSLVVLLWIVLHFIGVCIRVHTHEPEEDLLINA